MVTWLDVPAKKKKIFAALAPVVQKVDSAIHWAVANSGEWPGGPAPPPPLFLDQIEARRAEYLKV